jgi:hypothetical protein
MNHATMPIQFNKQEMNMEYRVKTFRDAGLEARWTTTYEGRPLIVLRNPNSDAAHQRETWYACDNKMWKSMLKYQKEGAEDFIRKGYDGYTILAPFFSIPI